MNARHFVVACMALTTATWASAAVGQDGNPAANAAPAANDSGKLICEDVPMTGTRLQTQRVCGTKSQWRAKQKEWDQTTRTQLSQCANPGGNMFAQKSCSSGAPH